MNARFRFAVYGTVFGIFFPVIGTIIEAISEFDRLDWSGVVAVQRNSPLLWIIDTAPLFLGLLASFSGVQIDRLNRRILEIRSRMDAINKSNAVIEFSTDKKIVFANDTFCRLFGYPENEIKGLEHHVLVQPEYAASKDYQEFWNTLLSGKHLQTECGRVARDGSQVWLQATYNPVFNADGKLIRILKIATDVTEKVNQQREIEIQRKQFSDLLNFVDRAAIVSKADARGKITYVNEKFTEVSGYTLPEVLGKDHNVVNSGVHPPEMWKDMYQTVIREKGIWNRVITNRARNGTLYHVDTYIKAEFDPITGTLTGYTSIRQDLTALKNREQEIRSRMEAINKSNAVIEFSTDRKIIFANETFCQLFGFKEEELRGMEHRSLVRPEYADSAEYQNFWNTLLAGKHLQAEYERVRKDGTVIWLQATYNPVFDIEGKLVRILKIATDVTEKVNQQREIEIQRKQFSDLLNFVDRAAIVSKADAKGKITYVNEKFTEVSGYTLPEVLGKDHNVVNSGVHPPEMWKDMYQTVIREKGIWNRVITNRARNGTLYHVDTYIKAEFDPIKGTLTGYTSIRQDLTALKSREQEIRSRMEAINKSNAVIEFSIEKKIIFANETFCALFGYKEEELRGIEHRSLVRPEYAESAEYQNFWNTLLAGKHLQAEYERVRKDGTVIWLQATYNPVFDIEGKLVRILKIATDVTEKVNQQREIEIQRKQFRELLNFVDRAAIVSKADAKGKITYVNEKFTEVSGYTLPEVLGKDHNVVNSGVHPPEMWKDMYQTVIREKGIWNRVITNRARNGTLYHVDTYIKAEFDPIKGTLTGYTSIRQDLTALKSREQEIRSRMEAINKSNAVIEFSTDRKIIFANETFCQLFGYAEAELKGMDHRMLVQPEYAESAEYQEFWGVLQTGRHLQSEYERVKKDGTVVWLQATYNPVFDVEGKLVRILKIATDITLRKNNEAELKQKNSYLEHAARILRHDMHSGINTYIPRGVSALRRRLSDEIVRELKLEPPLKMLEGGLKHTQKVYKGVYEFTNLVKKDALLSKELLNLTTTLSEFLEGTAYRSDVHIGELPSASISEQLFCTAVDNLIRNGLRYNDSPSKWVKVFMADESHLGILDNGRGITQQEFDFFSTNSARRENQKESGSGLGLGICVAILKEHGFGITVQKAEPSGTLIKIKIF